MKSLKRLFLVALTAVAFAMPATSQVRFGIKAGTAINKMSFDKNLLNSDNRAGFTGGIMTEFTAPIIGIGFDASVMYVNRSVEFTENNATITKNRSYIDIPVNLKWKIGIPVIGKVITPFLTTGPDFSFLCSKKEFNEAYKNKSVDFGWNFGFGLQLVNHFQLAANYGIGLSKSVEGNNSGSMWEGKNRCWTVTAAYIF